MTQSTVTPEEKEKQDAIKLLTKQRDETNDTSLWSRLNDIIRHLKGEKQPTHSPNKFINL